MPVAEGARGSDYIATAGYAKVRKHCFGQAFNVTRNNSGIRRVFAKELGENSIKHVFRVSLRRLESQTLS
jgi:hypothetical protein